MGKNSEFQGTDKEYHLRVARVNELRLELENLTTEQKTERTELSELVERHHTNLNLGTDKRYEPCYESNCVDFEIPVNTSSLF